MSIPTEFIRKIANDYTLSLKQEQILVFRMEGLSYQEIAAKLNTTPGAALKQMGEVYKRMQIPGTRSKEKRLRAFLHSQFQQSQTHLATENLPENHLQLTQQPEFYPIVHNLPSLSTKKLIGRDHEINQLLEFLSPNHPAHIISIAGISGIGKTALILEVAYRCLQTQNQETIPPLPEFEAIIFTSSKPEYLLEGKLITRPLTEPRLQDICRAIGKTLEQHDIQQYSGLEQLQRTKDCLDKTPTLLIVDNLETLENEKQILGFLWDLPPNVKVVITTRNNPLFTPIQLSPLPPEESSQLISYYAAEKGINIDTIQAEKLYQKTGGIPLAFVYVIGQIASGYRVEEALEKFQQPDSEINRFCFQTSLELISKQPAYRLLIAVAIINQNATREAIIAISGVENIGTSVADGLATLQQLSLINLEKERYNMLTFTRGYVLAELAENPSLETEIRKNWIHYYRKISENYRLEYQEWQTSSIKLQQEWENIIDVVRWMKQKEHQYLQDVWIIFQNVNSYAYVNNDWDTILDVSEWLMNYVDKLANEQDYIQLALSRIRPLSLRGTVKDLQEAENLINHVFTINKSVHHSDYWNLVIEQIYVAIQQENFSSALQLLKQQKNQLESTHLATETYQRFVIQFLYYEAQIYYWIQDFQQAENLYLQALSKVEEMQWIRGKAFIQHWLADVYIAMNKLTTAEDILADGLTVAQKYQDLRCIAHYQLSYAQLAKKRNDISEMQEMAKLARTGFQKIGLYKELQKVERLLSS